MDNNAADVQNRHANTLLFGLDKLRTNRWILDCAIEVGSETFEAHSAVLAGCSGYFCSKIRERWTNSPNQKLKFQINDVLATGMKHCIDFMYIGKSELTSKNTLEVLQAADKINLEALIDLCLRSLDRATTPENCFQIRRWYKKFDLRDDEENINRFIAENIDAVLISTGFLNTTIDELEKWLKGLDVHNYTLQWSAVTSWINFDPKTRNGKLLYLLTPFLERFPPDFLILGLREGTSVSQTQTERILSIYFQQILVNDSNYEVINLIANETTTEAYTQAKYLVKIVMEKDLERISMTQGMRNLSEKAIFFVFDSLKTVKFSEKIKWKLAANWIKHDIPNRENCLPRLFDMINFEKFDQEFFHNVICRDPLVQESSICYEHVLASRRSSSNPPPSKKARAESAPSVFITENSSKVTAPKKTVPGVSQRFHFPSAKKSQNETLHNFFSLNPGSSNEISKARTLISDQEERYFIAVNEKSTVIKGIDLKTGRFCTLSKSDTLSAPDFLGIINIKDQLFWMRGSSLKKRKENKRWKKLKGLDQNPKADAKIVACHNRIYVVEEQLVISYDPTANTWEKRPADEITGTNFCICATNDHLYILGGKDTPRRALMYDPHRYTTREIVPMVRPRVNSAAVAVNKKVYVMGGSDHEDAGRSLECYCPDMDGWMELETMLVSRWKLCACVYNNKIYAIGGSGKSTKNMESVDVYDLNKTVKKWERFSGIDKIGIPFTACVVKTSSL